MDEQSVARVIAWLMRNEGVAPEAIERAIASAQSMRLGEITTLDGDNASLRRAFIYEQLNLINPNKQGSTK